MKPSQQGKQSLLSLQAELRACTTCEQMQGPPVHGRPVYSPVMLVGQAPGVNEIEQSRPFCWTAGKTLFRWFESIGVDEETFRSRGLLADALALIDAHPAWQQVRAGWGETEHRS
jgi:uracil-DNA glycosylase